MPGLQPSPKHVRNRFPTSCSAIRYAEKSSTPPEIRQADDRSDAIPVRIEGIKTASISLGLLWTVIVPEQGEAS
jgi:hypothetical protein